MLKNYTTKFVIFKLSKQCNSVYIYYLLTYLLIGFDLLFKVVSNINN